MADSASINFFYGPNGLRAGWRILIFFVLMFVFAFAAGRVVDRILGPDPPRDTPMAGGILMGTFLIALLLATWIMTKIEGRTFADYGLPWRRAFSIPFWIGAAFSFASLAAFLFVLRLAGVFSFGSLALHGTDILKYGAAWAVTVFLSALLEDFFYRGYFLFTLSTGIGFWPAAVISSLWMGGMHYLNPGGHGLGPVAATEYCLVTCLVLRRTGNLWMPLGLHAGWAWSIIFFFGLPSSGFAGLGHLLNGNLHGSTWLTGGEFSIEGSVPNLFLLALWGLFFWLILRGVKYPDPAAIPDPRRTSHSTAPATS